MIYYGAIACALFEVDAVDFIQVNIATVDIDEHQIGLVLGKHKTPGKILGGLTWLDRSL